MSIEEFTEHVNEHASRASDIPRLNGYTIAVALDPDVNKFDGIVELYFDDPEDIDRALESEAMEGGLADLENFAEIDQNVDMVFEETARADEI